MLRRRMIPVTALLLLAFGVAFSFPAVRAAASDFLGLFRVQKFAAVSISPRQMALLEEIAERGLYPGELEMVAEPGEPQRVDSVEAAEGQTGLDVRAPAGLGRPDAVYVAAGGSGKLTVNLADARAILAAAGANPSLLPDSLAGAVIDVTVFDAVSLSWGEGVSLLLSPSPQVHYPEDVDAAVIGEAVLQALGVSRSRARVLARSIDWSNTLLLPIPEDVASFREVDVDGTAGLGLTSLDGRNSVLLWQKDGVLYALSGGMTVDELLGIGDSLR